MIGVQVCAYFGMEWGGMSYGWFEWHSARFVTKLRSRLPGRRSMLTGMGMLLIYSAILAISARVGFVQGFISDSLWLHIEMTYTDWAHEDVITNRELEAKCRNAAAWVGAVFGFLFGLFPVIVIYDYRMSRVQREAQ